MPPNKRGDILEILSFDGFLSILSLEKLFFALKAKKFNSDSMKRCFPSGEKVANLIFCDISLAFSENNISVYLMF